LRKINLIILFFIPIICIGQTPNYSEDIAPIIYNKCLQCHHTNGIAPLSLENYIDAASNSGMIQHVTSTGEMPPWPPDTLYRNFSYENVLTFDEITKITDWIVAGVPIGDTALLPPKPIFSNNSILGGVPDLELQMPNYISNATSTADDYICFSIPTGLIQNKKVRAIEVIPGNMNIVHHVLVSIDPFPNSTIVTTPNCMAPPGDLIYGYAPGSLPITYPNGISGDFGVTLPAGSSISLGMHYPEGSFGELDSTKVRFYFYPDNTNIREIETDFLITNWSFVLPPHQITAVDDSFGPLSQDFSLMSIFPHMHLLGKDLECYAITPMNDTINLIRINQWDFEWQGFYFFEKFIKIPAGSIIYAKGNYDNTVSLSNPNPTLVYPGDNTTDEMFVFGFQFLPYQEGDEDIVIQSDFILDISQNDNITNARLNHILDILGRKVNPKTNTPLFYMFEDGRVEKRIIIE